MLYPQIHIHGLPNQQLVSQYSIFPAVDFLHLPSQSQSLRLKAHSCSLTPIIPDLRLYVLYAKNRFRYFLILNLIVQMALGLHLKKQIK